MKKVLVVEDDQFLANAYKLKLSKSDFDVKIAGDGQEALKIMEEFTPEVVLLDLIMPNMDGFETLKAMKALDKLKSIPVIVASNLGQKEDLDRAMKLGANDFIIKSNVSIEDIIKKVNKLIN